VVAGDEARLRQILLNLCGNAVKFTETGSVSMIAEPARGAADMVAIRVADTGIGIAREALDRLFNRFEQADASTTRRFGGTGLGLAIARELAELMGGTLIAASVPGRGSEFTLTIPLPAARLPQVAREEPRSLSVPGLELLIADDDPTNRWVIARQLERLGCRAVIVADGAAALEAWRAEPERWHAVITDWHMPVLDGLGLLDALQADPVFTRRRPAVAMMTASGLPEEIERARRAGADHVLVKPVTLDRLVAVLSRVSEVDPKAAFEPRLDAPGDATVLDTAELEALCGGDAGTLADFLRRFEGRLQEGLQAVADARGVDERRSAAHGLRGAAASVGASALAAACGELERATGDAGPELAAVDREAARLREALRERMVT
jgi:CheY-like chemotaxis protein